MAWLRVSARGEEGDRHERRLEEDAGGVAAAGVWGRDRRLGGLRG